MGLDSLLWHVAAGLIAVWVGVSYFITQNHLRELKEAVLPALILHRSEIGRNRSLTVRALRALSLALSQNFRKNVVIEPPLSAKESPADLVRPLCLLLEGRAAFQIEQGQEMMVVEGREMSLENVRTSILNKDTATKANFRWGADGTPRWSVTLSLLLIALLPLSGRAADQKVGASLETVCGKSSSLSAEKARERMQKELMGDSTRNAALVEALRKGEAPRCKTALEDLTKQMLEKKEETEAMQGRMTFVSLALAAGIPDATRVVEQEMERGEPEAWLDLLRRNSVNTYNAVLTKWVASLAQKIRETQQTSQTSPALYGSSTSQENARPLVQLSSPILVHRYLVEAETNKRKLSTEELSNLNAIFAGATPAYRGTFSSPLKTVLSRQSAEWIQTFRKEPVWVQIRLFSLMSDMRGPEVTRELMWLSTNHKDMRVRALANSALDDALETKQKQ